MNFNDCQLAATRIAPFLINTPLLEQRSLSALADLDHLYCKAESLQQTGSFKARGALNALLQAKADGIVTSNSIAVCHSTGNHGLGVSFAAQCVGIQAQVFVPHQTNQAKVDAMRNLGATVSFCSQAERAAVTDAFCQRTPESFFVHPYNHQAVVCGQATIAMEMLAQKNDIDVLLVPVSGGGMIAGAITAVETMAPNCTIVAVTPKGKNLDVALEKNQRVLNETNNDALNTIADGMISKWVGDFTWPLIRENVKYVIEVEDEEIREAMRKTFKHLKLAVEPSGATALAAVFSAQFQKWKSENGWKTAGIIICGGNIDIERYSRLIKE